MLRTIINTRLNDQYLQSLYTYSDSSSKASNYKLLKHTSHFWRKYIDAHFYVLDFQTIMFQLKRADGTMYYYKILKINIILYSISDIGDEFHYIFICAFFKSERRGYLPYFCQSKLNTYKFYKLFN